MQTCPPDELLEAFLEEQAEAEGDCFLTKWSDFAAHLDVCESCCRKLDLLTGKGTAGNALPPSEGDFLKRLAASSGEMPARHQANAQLPQIGYEILAELGRGGMGVVYRAWHTRLKRPVALKMILSGGYAGEAELERFRREAEASARLQHPNIVQIYEIGEHQGLPYLALEFVEGGTLAERLKGTPLPPRHAAKMTALLAQAVQAAHDKGILHRDLKPANILLMPAKEKESIPIPDRLGTKHYLPKIADFGLAKRLDGEAGVSTPGYQTQSGAVMGTPSYMAPEQAEGKNRQMSPAVDVYALGAILYDLLTGCPPFKGESTLETLEQVRTHDPVPPRRLQPKVPRDLETICLKCLAKTPAGRYATAHELAEDLGRFLRGEPIRARPTSWPEKLWKWARQHPAVAAVILVAVMGVSGIIWKWIEAESNATEVRKQKETAEAALERAERSDRERALDKVNALLNAAPGGVPVLLADLERDRDIVLPRLRELWAEGGNDVKRMRVGVALMAVEPETVRDELAAWLLKVDDPAEVLLAREALLPHKEELRERFWRKAEDAKAPLGERFRALVALEAFDPDRDRWARASQTAVGQLVLADSLYLVQWIEVLRPVRGALMGPLGELILDPNTTQYGILRSILDRYRPEAVALMQRELAATRKDEKDLLLLPVAERERLARRQAQAGVTLMHLGDAESVWPLLRHTSQPEARSQLLWRMGLHKVEPRLLVKRLDEEKDDSARRALIVGLGEFTDAELPAEVRGPLTAKLLQWYRDDPDAGVHGAIDWLLRHGKEGLSDRPLDWGEAKELEKIDAELKRRDPDGVRRWYINGQGQTIVLLPRPADGPHEFRMGTPADEPSSIKDNERLHIRRIDRSLAIASKPVTVEQWERFLKDRPDVKHVYRKEHSPEPGGPIIAVTWYEAAQYCNWLSEKEGIPETEWCYPREIKPGMTPYKDYLKRKGYRLPTEAEWELACRAGAASSRYYGSSIELLPRYAWYFHNSANQTWPVGQKRPNDLGLFDMHGNVWTWVQDRHGDYPNEGIVGDKEDNKGTEANLERVSRGGGFYFLGRVIRSAYRNKYPPDIRGKATGLRPARTYD